HLRRRRVSRGACGACRRRAGDRAAAPGRRTRDPLGTSSLRPAGNLPRCAGSERRAGRRRRDRRASRRPRRSTGRARGNSRGGGSHRQGARAPARVIHAFSLGGTMDIASMYESARPVVVAFALKVVGAIVLYIIGRWLIGIVGSLITKALGRQRVEPT